MADIIYPIQGIGSIEPLTYAVRNVRGVEPLAASPTDRSGFNEEAEFTARADKALRNEHTSVGIHTGWKFPCAIINILWDGTTYSIADDSEDRGVIHGTTSIGSLASTTAGVINVTLTTALPSSTIMVHTADAYSYSYYATADKIIQTVLKSITSTTVFQIYRWYGSSLTTLALTDGACSIAVWSK